MTDSDSGERASKGAEKVFATASKIVAACFPGEHARSLDFLKQLRTESMSLQVEMLTEFFMKANNGKALFAYAANSKERAESIERDSSIRYRHPSAKELARLQDPEVSMAAEPQQPELNINPSSSDHGGKHGVAEESIAAKTDVTDA